MRDTSNAHVFNHPVMVKASTDTYRNLQDNILLYVFEESDNNDIVFLQLYHIASYLERCICSACYDFRLF